VKPSTARASDLDRVPEPKSERIDLITSLPILTMHIGALGVLFVSFSWTALGVCLFLYALRACFITGIYHRYFSHKTYKTSRVFQFILALVGTTAAQNGPLWWAAHHRRHHRYSDQEGDIHSPIVNSVFWSHFGWLLSKEHFHTDYKVVQDFSKYPELRFLDKYHMLMPIALGVFMFWLGEFLATHYPSLGTTGPQMLFYGFFLSTVILYHATFLVNSMAHLWGTRRFKTSDHSRNNWLIAILAMGEGWHNNHHRYPQSERQGFYWWEIDVTHYGLYFLSKLGLVWNLNRPPQHIYEEARRLKSVK